MGVSASQAAVLLRVMRDMGMHVEARESDYLLGGRMLRIRATDAVSIDLDAQGDDWVLVLLRHDAPDADRRPAPAELTMDATPRQVAHRVLEEILVSQLLVEEAAAVDSAGIDHDFLGTVADLTELLLDDHDVDAEVAYWPPPSPGFDFVFAGFEPFALRPGAERWELVSGADDLDVSARTTHASPLRLVEDDESVIAAWAVQFLLTTVAPAAVGDLSPVTMTDEQTAVVRNGLAFLRATAEHPDAGGLAARRVLRDLGR